MKKNRLIMVGSISVMVLIAAIIYCSIFFSQPRSGFSDEGPALHSAVTADSTMPLLNSVRGKKREDTPNDGPLSRDLIKTIQELSQQLNAENTSDQAFIHKIESQDLTSLPPSIQKAWEKLDLVIKKIQGNAMQDDRIRPEDLKPMSHQAPEQLVDQIQELDAFSIQEDIEIFIRQKAVEPEITRRDIKELRDRCLRETTCIEKGMKYWMDNNHLLDDEDLKFATR